MQGFNDNNAHISALGNLSLGGAGQNDGAGHATYGYAKNDVTLPVNAIDLVSGTMPALTYATGDIPIRLLAASTTHKVAVPMPQEFVRSFVAATGRAANPHGILVKNVALFYVVKDVDLTSFATFAVNTAPLAAGAALPTVTALTTTLAGNTLTAAANTYAAVATVTTPAFVTVNDTLIWAVATIVTPAGSTVQVLGASWRVAYAMY